MGIFSGIVRFVKDREYRKKKIESFIEVITGEKRRKEKIEKQLEEKQIEDAEDIEVPKPTVTEEVVAPLKETAEEEKLEEIKEEIIEKVAEEPKVATTEEEVLRARRGTNIRDVSKELESVITTSPYELAMPNPSGMFTQNDLAKWTTDLIKKTPAPHLANVVWKNQEALRDHFHFSMRLYNQNGSLVGEVVVNGASPIAIADFKDHYLLNFKYIKPKEGKKGVGSMPTLQDRFDVWKTNYGIRNAKLVNPNMADKDVITRVEINGRLI